MLIQQEDGFLEYVKVTLNPPATDSEIDKLPFNIPADYKDFLKLHNGAKLFWSTEFGGGFELLSIEEILNDLKNLDDCPKGWFPIAFGDEGSRLMITPYKKEKYLFWMDTGTNYDDDHYIGLSFYEWLEYFIVSQGSIFWLWNVRNYNRMG